MAANTLWIAVGQGGNTIARSTDGIMWTGLGTTTFLSIGKGVAYGKDLSGNDVWVAVGAGGNTVAYSTNNGNTWTGLTNTVFSGSGNRVLYDPTASLWFAVGTGSNSVATTSYPTISWRGQENLFPTTLASYSTNCVYGPAINYSGTQNITGYLVGGYSTGSLFALSANGTTWQMASSASLGASGMNTVAYGNGIFVAGGVPTAGGNTFATSIDGNTWTGRGGSTLSGNISQIAYGNGLFMAVGFKAASGSTVMRSTDGITWTNLTDLYNFGARCVFYCDGRWFVGGFSDAIKYSDSNGSFWSSSTPASLFSHTRSFGYGNGIVASVGQGTTNSLATSTDFGVTWTGRGLLLAGYGNDIKYNGGVWLAVGGDNTTTGNIIVKSTDNGTTWTQIVTFNTSYFTSINGVQNANGLWYISGRGAYYLAYSITNNPTSISDFTMVSTSSVSFSTNAAFLTTFNYQKPKYIVGGQGMRGSVDGLSWFEIINQPFQRVMDVYWNGTIWVGVGAGVGDGKNTIAYSYDGINWVGIGASIFTTVGNSVYYSTANSLWIATGQGGNTIATSADGVTWTGRGVTTFNTLGSKVIYDSNLLVAAGQGASPLVTSTDGINWNGTNTVLSSVKKVAFDGNLFVVVGGGIATSTNGTIWTDNTTPSGISATGVGYGNGKWVVVGRNNQNSQGGISYSTNGTSWTTATSNGGISEIYGVAYGNGLWVAVGQPYNENAGNNAIATSTDGITWTGRGQTVFPYSPNSIYGGTSVAYGNGLWVATGYGNSIATSTDGITWTGRGKSILPTATSVAYANGIWVAVGNGQWVSGSSGGGSFKIATSTDGITWTGRGTSALPNAMSVAYGNGLWVVVGSVDNNLDTIATSPDGITWTGRGKPIITHSINGVTYGNGRWVAVGSGTRIIINSTDGINWTPTNISVFTRGYDIAGPSLPSSTYSTAVLSGFSVPTKTFGDAAFELVAPTSNSDGAFTYTSSNIAVATVTNNMVTIVGGGTATITATQASTAIYASNTITATLTVSKITTVLSNFSAITKTMGDASFAIVTPTTNSDGAFFTYTSSNTAVATITNNIITIVGAGSSTITVVQFATQNYTSGTVTTTLTVNQGTTVLSNFSAITKAFGNAAFAITPPTTNGNGAFTYTSSDTAVATITGSVITIVGVGTSTITANQANTTNYSAATITTTLTVNQATTVQSNFSVSTKTVGDPDFSLVAPTTNSNVAITYTSSNTAVATLAGNVITITGAGTSTITASQASSVNYSSSSITTTLQVSSRNDLWVAVGVGGGAGTGNTIATSYDGITWTGRGANVFTSQGWSVTYANNLWIAGGDGGNGFATSTDGINWTGRVSVSLRGITYANDLWLAGSSGTNTIVKSTDGINWVGSSESYGGQLFSGYYASKVAFGNGVWVAVGYSGGGMGNTIARSTNNANLWTGQGNAVFSQGYDVAFANNLWVAVGQSSGNSIVTSTDGLSWTGRVNRDYSYYCVAYANSLWVAGGGSAIATSVDGITWTRRTVTNNPSLNVNAVSYGNGLWVAVGSNGSMVATSVNGLTWTASTGTTVFVNHIRSIVGPKITTALLSNFVVPLKNIGDAAFSIVAPTTNSNGTFTYTSSNLAVATITGSIITIVGMGTSTITASQAMTPTFSSATTTATLTVENVKATLSNFSVPAKIFGDAPFSIVAPTSNSDGAITYTSSNTAVATVDGSTITIVGGGTSTISAIQANTADYGSATITAPLVVSQTSTVLTNFAVPAKNFGNAAFSVVAPTSNSNGAFTYTSSNLAVATIAGSTITIVGVGSSTITAVQASTASYASATTTATLLVSQGTPVINFAAITKTFGNAAFTISAPSSNSSGAFTYTSSDTAVATIAGTTVTIVGGGTATITASQASTTNFLAGTTTTTMTVNKATPTISSFSTITKTFGNADFALVAPTTNSTGAFTYTSSNTAVATIAGNVVTIVGAGSSTITATQATTTNYLAGTITATLTVNKITTVLSGFSVAAKTFGDASFNLVSPTTNSTGTFTYTSSNTAVATIVGSVVTIVGAGTSTITASQATNTNYTANSTTASLVVSKGTPTYTSFTIPQKIIGNSAFAITPPVSNSTGAFTYTSSNTAVATIAGSTITIVGIGTSTITANQATTTNYLASTTTALFSVINVIPTITGFSVPTKTFGDAAFNLVTPSSNSTGAFTYTSSNTAVATIAGNVVTIVGGGISIISAIQASTTSFTTATVTATLTVNGKTTVLSGFSVAAKTFGDAAFSLVAPTTNSNGAFTYTSSNTAVATIVGNVVTIVGGGTSTISAVQASTNNYLTATITSSLIVSQGTPTITNFAAITKEFGDVSFNLVNPTTNSTGAFTYTSSNAAVATVAGNVVTIVGIGTTTITASQASTSNYISGTITATLQIIRGLPTLSNFSIPNKTIGNTSFIITPPTSNGDGVFTYTSSNELVAKIVGNRIAIVGIGTSTITATQGTTTNFLSATTTANFQVNAITTVITISQIPAKTFNDIPFKLQASSNSSSAITYTSSDTSVLTIAGDMATIVSAGTTTITASQESNATYTSGTTTYELQINLITTVLTNFSPITKTFGNMPFSIRAPSTNSDGLFTYTSSNTAVATITNNVITIIGAGTSTITASQAATTNFSAETISATLTVSPATPLLTNFSAITKTFGDATFNITPPSSNSSGLITYTSSNRLVATIADNSINIVGAGSCTISATQASTANYAIGTITTSLAVSKATTSMINFTISERTFGIAPFTLVPPTTNSNGLITYTSSNTDVATIVGNNVTIVGIGSSTITAVQPSTANFLAGTISTTLGVIRGTPVITNFSGITKTFGDTDFALVPPTSNSNGLITYTSSNLAVATVTDNILTIVGVGSSTITAIQSSSTNFLSGTITATITVTPVTTVLTNFSAITKTFGNDAFTITPPTTNSTGDFTYTSSNTAVATITNNMVTIVGGGNTTITVVQASTANYTSATTTAVLTVNPIRTVLSNFPAITKIPGDASFNLVPPTSNSNGLITYTSSNPAVATIDGDSVTIVGRGTSTIIAVQQSTSNYSSETIRTTLQVSSIITVLSNFSAITKIVGDASFSLVPPTTNGTGAFAYTSSNLLIATIDGDVVTVVGTGTCTITATQASTENSTSATITTSLVVGRATTVITNFSVPAKVFGNAPFSLVNPTTNSNGAFTYTSSNTDVATISRNVVTIVGIGTSTITASQPNTANYTSGTITATFEVGQGTPVLTNFSLPTKIIGDAAFAIVPPVSNSTGLITYTSSDSSVATIDGNMITIVGRGTSTITAVQESTTNFVSGTITALFTINKIPTVLTSFAIDAKTFGDASFAVVDPSSNSDGLITYTSSNTAVATIDGNVITIVGGGNTTITAVQSSTSNYTQGSISALFQVYQIKTVLSEFDIPAKIIGEEAFTINPPITNGDGSFVYTSSNPAVATIEGSTVTIVGLGNSIIKAVHTSTANYTTNAITTIFQVKLIRTVLSNFVVPAKTVGDTNFSLVPPTTNSNGAFTYTSSNLLVATVAGDVVTIVGTGNVTITAFQESTENSTSARITASLSVNKATNSISWFSVPEKAFGNEPFTLVPPTTNSNGAFTYTSSNTSVATIVRNVVTIVGIGTSTITAVQANTVNYTAGTITATFEVTQGTPTITNFVVPAKTAGDASFAIVAPTSNSDGAFTYTSSDPEVATIEGSTVTIAGVGTSTITATQASTTNFVSATTTTTFQVNKITTILTNFEIPIKTFRDASFAIVDPSSNSDGAFTYTSSDIEVATIINGSMISIVGAGNATITAVQASTDDYTSATITELFQVNQMRTVLSNFAIPAKIIGEGEFAIVPPTTNSNNVFTYTSSNTEVATIEDETINIVGLGTSIITANQASTDDYTSARITALFEVNLLTTVLSDFVVPAKINGDEPFAITPPTTNTTGAFTYTSSNRLVATVTNNIITIIGVGSCIITAVQASTANSTSATITAPLVITKNTPAITNFSVPEKLFGNAPFKLIPPTSNGNGAFTYTSSDTSVATINRDMVTIVGIGSSTITAVQASTANFVSGSITAVFQVDSGTPILSGFVVPTKTALDASFALVTPTTNSDGAFTYTSSNTDVATIEGDVVTIIGAGTSTITADQASTEKYLSGTITATFTVNSITTVLTNFPALSSALGNAAFTITPPTTNSDGAFTYTSSRLSVATIDGDVVTIVGGGISTITAVQSSTTKYTSATITTQIQVSALTTVLSNFSVPTKAVGDAPFAITTPTTNGDGTFTYTSSNTAVVTIVGNMATIVGAGTATITAIQSSTPNYSSARITALLTVNRGVPIITNFTMPIKEIGMPDFRIIDPSSTSIGAFTYTSSNIKVATIFGNIVSIKGLIGNTIITASQAMSTNYIAGTVTTTFFVNQLSPTLSTPFVVPETKTVGDATFKLIAPKSNSISPFVYTSSNQAVVKIAKDVVSIIGSGTATITATQAATKSFGPKTVTGSIQVNPRIVFLNNFFIPRRIVGTAPFTIVPPTTNSNGAFTYTSSNTEVATIAGNVITVVGVGSSIITASQASTANFTAGTISTTLQVNLPTPQVGSMLITNKSLTNSSFTIVDPTKPADNTSAWEYTSSDTTVATIDENEITLLQPGIVTITALLSSDSLYNSAILMTQFSVSPENIAPSSFVFVRSSEVVAIIPVTIIPQLNTVLPTTISTPANIAKFNPKLGTLVEKHANHNMIVNSLFNVFPTAVSISIPSTLLFMPATISIAKLKTVRIVRPNGTTVESPLVINTIAADSAVVFLCSIVEFANSVRLNGVGTNLGNFIVISKGLDNKYLVTRTTTKTNVSVSDIRTNGDMISFAGITALIGYI